MEYIYPDWLKDGFKYKLEYFFNEFNKKLKNNMIDMSDETNIQIQTSSDLNTFKNMIDS